MTPLQRLFEIYRILLETPAEAEGIDMSEVEGLNIDAVMEKVRSVEPQRVEEVREPREGVVFELLPSMDSYEMLFLVNDVFEEMDTVQLVPLTRFTEFATPEDVLFELSGKVYMAQTDLAFDMPLENFHKNFGNRKLYKMGELSTGDLERVKAVVEGREKGDGGMSGGVKAEFKRLEAKRYFPIFMQSVLEEEFRAEVEKFFEEHRELKMVAGTQEKGFGEKEGIGWIYDREREVIIIKPLGEFRGRKVRIALRKGGEELTLFEGTAPESIEVPLPSELYSDALLEEGLFVEPME